MATVKRIELDDLVRGDFVTVGLRNGEHRFGEFLGFSTGGSSRAILLRSQELLQEPRTTLIRTSVISHMDRHEA